MNKTVFLFVILGILGILIYRYNEKSNLANIQLGGNCPSCENQESSLISEGRIGADYLQLKDKTNSGPYKEWNLDNCNQPFYCCDNSSDVKTQKYIIPQNKKDTCAYAFTVPSKTSPQNTAGSFSPLSGLFNLKVNANAGAFTDKAIFDNAETDLVETPCGPVSTFNAYASPMAIPNLPNGVVEYPKVVTNIMDNAIPPHMMTQVELVRRAPYGIPEEQPVPVNALPIESPCNFGSEKTNLASFFKRNTNIFFKDEQQFPICQTAWPSKNDCLNNIMYNTDLSPKENFIVNKVS